MSSLPFPAHKWQYGVGMLSSNMDMAAQPASAQAAAALQVQPSTHMADLSAAQFLPETPELPVLGIFNAVNFHWSQSQVNLGG